jgi:hypothetical protein
MARSLARVDRKTLAQFAELAGTEDHRHRPLALPEPEGEFVEALLA